jgi:poly(ribitol-phosphate) beta-N-acetylglucosaminyltransferase
VTPRVSVVVPLFNPGPYLERCITSIFAQSLPPGDLEAIFVDDGSTDGSGARLDEVAAAHANARVIHQENSGWPGKPRNVGLDVARGDYVFFLDADDRLGPEALERLLAMAVRTGADIVLGQIVGHHRFAPRDVFAADRDRATLWDAPLIDALTIHKLFRRGFLVDHGFRFPEGRRRLEDLAFVLPAYFAAETISILGSYPCYYLYWRDDRANISRGRVEPAYYFGFLREIIGIVEAHTEPGPRRDSLLQRFVRLEMLARLRSRDFLESGDDYRAPLLAEIRSVIAAHIPPTVDELLAPAQRVQMALVRADRLDLLVELAAADQHVRAVATVGRLEVAAGREILVALEAGLEREGRPLGLLPDPGGLILPVPDAVAAALPRDVRRVPRQSTGSATVLLRRRDDSTEFAVATTSEAIVTERPDGSVETRYHLAPRIDPRTVAAGAPMWPGRWDVVVRLELLGYVVECRLQRSEREGRAQLRAPTLEVRPLEVVGYWAEGTGHLVLQVGPAWGSPFVRRTWRRVRRLGGRARRLLQRGRV